MLTFLFSGADGKMTRPEILTAGMVGKEVMLEFTPEWGDFHKNVVYQAGETRVVHLNVEGRDVIPSEVLEKPLEQLMVSVYGVSRDQTRVIPTVRAMGPVILPGADPNGDPGADPTLPIWGQLQQLIGDLSRLETAQRNNLVEAINAAALTGDGDAGATFLPKVDSSGILSWTNDRGLPNPTPIRVRGDAGPKGETGDQGPAGPAGAPSFDGMVKTIAYGGLSGVAPENTPIAYILAKERGYCYAQCDVRFTADGVAVLLRDATVDRTSNGAGAIGSLNFEQVFALDFGSWKAAEYANTKVGVFGDFTLLCRALDLRPYIELKADGGYTQEQIQELVNMVTLCGLAEKASWISPSADYLAMVRGLCPKARLGYQVETISETMISIAHNLRNGSNQVFLYAHYQGVNYQKVRLCLEAELPLEAWVVDSEDDVLDMHPYVTGIASGSLMAGSVLYTDSVQLFASGSGPVSEN